MMFIAFARYDAAGQALAEAARRADASDAARAADAAH